MISSTGIGHPAQRWIRELFPPGASSFGAGFTGVRRSPCRSGWRPQSGCLSGSEPFYPATGNGPVRWRPESAPVGAGVKDPDPVDRLTAGWTKRKRIYPVSRSDVDAGACPELRRRRDRVRSRGRVRTGIVRPLERPPTPFRQIHRDSTAPGARNATGNVAHASSLRLEGSFECAGSNTGETSTTGPHGAGPSTVSW